MRKFMKKIKIKIKNILTSVSRSVMLSVVGNGKEKPGVETIPGKAKAEAAETETFRAAVGLMAKRPQARKIPGRRFYGLTGPAPPQ
jgi:hypothetical protein